MSRPPEDSPSRAAPGFEEEAARLRALVAASPLGIDIMDLDGRPIFYNPKCEELHGIDFRSAGGRGWERAVHPEDRERVATTWYAAARAGKSWSDTYRFLHPDGCVVWVIGRAAPIYVRGRHVGFVGTLEDITEHKEAEAERERLLEQERSARRQAEAAMRLRDATLATVAHELRTPLSTIAANLDALLVRGARAEALSVRQIETARRTVDKMERLIRGLLDMSRITAGTFEVRAEPISLPALLDEAAETFAARARESGVELRVDVAPGLPDVLGDSERVVQVLSNLVDNALKFTPNGGSIRVSARACNGVVQVTVDDTGPGIPSDAAGRVFEYFWQAERESGVGTGLGLAIAKGIVEAHGGAIWVEAARPGACLRFTLPRARPA